VYDEGIGITLCRCMLALQPDEKVGGAWRGCSDVLFHRTPNT